MIQGKKSIHYGVGVALDVAIGVAVGLDVGLAVALGLGVAVGFVVGVGLAGGSVGVGVTKIILMAPSSSDTGERIFFPETKTPTIMATSTNIPMITVIAASVRFRSSMA